jgi:hypothetical protein
VQSKDNPADLINVALDELVLQSCEQPGYTTLDAMAASIRTEVNTGMFTTVTAGPDRMQRARLLWVDPATRRSEFDRLKDSAGQVQATRRYESITSSFTSFSSMAPPPSTVIQCLLFM